MPRAVAALQARPRLLPHLEDYLAEWSWCSHLYRPQYDQKLGPQRVPIERFIARLDSLGIGPPMRSAYVFFFGVLEDEWLRWARDPHADGDGGD
ncbi:MAG: hypothetical protein ACF8XB_04050 [Planctomycetota bacterium JB042]